MTILEARDLSFRYAVAQCPTIVDVSVAITQGVMSALVGPNGSGKSTLIRLLAGLLAPTFGTVLYQGRELKSISRRETAKKLAYVPQMTSRVFPFTALEVVLTGRSPYTFPFRLANNKDEQLAWGALEMVGVPHLAHRPVTELSGGERQLVSVARALAQEPECLLLDEPASSLDLKHRAELISTLRKLVHLQGLSVLVVTHDLSMLDPGFDCVFAMREGKVLVSGHPDEVLQDHLLAQIYDDPLVRARRVSGQLCVWSEITLEH